MLAVDEIGRRLFSLAVRPGEQPVVGGQCASGVGVAGSPVAVAVSSCWRFGSSAARFVNAQP